ncbi:MAG TPA: membrane protein insertase YidC [Terriglobia bacterium]|nr:membrane protein insertase YidC [Terriglobia bacterium]
MNLDQEKRVMIAFALSIVMLILFRLYFVKEQPPEPKKAAQTAAATPATQPGTPATATTATPAVRPAPAVLPVLRGAKPEDIVVENQVYRVTLSTQGAVVKSVVLKNYRDAKDELLDTVNAPACVSLGFPMSLVLTNPDLMAQVNQGIYIATAGYGTPALSKQQSEGLSGTPLSPPVTLTFTYSDGKVQVKKQFSFGAEYVAKVEVSLFDGQSYLPVEVTWPGGFGDHSLASGAIESYRQGVYGSIGDLTNVAQSKVKEDRTISGPLQVAGLEDKYFAEIFLPDAPDQVSFRLARQEWSPPDWTEKDKPKPLAATLVETQPKALGFRVFIGPKSLDVLKSVNPPLDSLVDFGWFSIVAKPLFIGLRYIEEHWIHNWGWAIILLTVILSTALFPLRLKGVRSAQEMQKVAPIIKGIQDKYKNYKFNDPRKQKMNEEVMKVYNEHGINPLGGCLPMVLQMPILYGFYRVLDLAIELRHAPWIWWVTDLSAPDRLHLMGLSIPVLVIFMTLAQYLAQRMTPTPTADPAQARMMMLMPLFMGFMFYRFASGMVLYWFTSSVVQILQQVFINRRMPHPTTLPVPRKPAEAKG